MRNIGELLDSKQLIEAINSYEAEIEVMELDGKTPDLFMKNELNKLKEELDRRNLSEETIKRINEDLSEQEKREEFKEVQLDLEEVDRKKRCIYYFGFNTRRNRKCN